MKIRNNDINLDIKLYNINNLYFIKNSVFINNVFSVNDLYFYIKRIFYCIYYVIHSLHIKCFTFVK